MQIARRTETSHGFLPYVQAPEAADARKIEEAALAALRALRGTSRALALEHLCTQFLEAAAVGWDGLEAEPMTADTFAVARDFLSALPMAFPNPEVAAREDGAVALDWFPSPDSMLAVVVFPDRRIGFASVCRDRRVRGTERFDGRVPDVIIEELRRLF